MPEMPKFKPSKDVLAANINRLMAGTPALQSNPKLSKRSELGLGTVARVRNAESAANLDTVDTLAETFGIQPWELLVEGGVVGQAQAQQRQPSPLALELAWLFDEVVENLTYKQRSMVSQAAQEAITRPLPAVLPNGEPTPAGSPGKRRV